MDIHQCQNCGQYFDLSQLLLIRDLTQRVDPGEPMPSGECPNGDCRALCQPTTLSLRETVHVLLDRMNSSGVGTVTLFRTPQTEEEQTALALVMQSLAWVEQARAALDH